MTGIRSRGRRGSTVVPNWRWEDQSLDPYDLRVAGWLASHADGYLEDHVTRNEIARRTGVSAGKVTGCLRRLAEAGIISTAEAPHHRGGGQRLVVTFDFDIWETVPAGHHVTTTDPSAGHDTTGVVVITRPAGGHHVTGSIGLQGEEQTREEQHTPTDVIERAVPNADELFDRFWALYPRKISKPAARRAFARALHRGSPLDIGRGLRAWCAYWTARNEPEFIPYPQKWLNQDYWENEPPPTPTPRRITAEQEARETLARIAERNGGVLPQRPPGHDGRLRPEDFLPPPQPAIGGSA